MKKRSRTMGIALAGMMMLSAMAVPKVLPQDLQESSSIVQTVEIEANAADVRKGYFNNGGTSWTGWTYIKANTGRNWRGQTYYKTPKVKMCTFDGMGWKSGGTMSVQVYSTSGAYVGTYTVNSGSKLTLKGGYSGYKIRIKRQMYNSTAKNFINAGKCIMWSIDASKNCYFGK
ncbi:MAG: hypothetical protein IKK51_06170 [Oscillospiraceae bacterium]|nr:hypothetical protein [Oscillospiraceae bacterium]